MLNQKLFYKVFHYHLIAIEISHCKRKLCCVKGDEANMQLASSDFINMIDMKIIQK